MAAYVVSAVQPILKWAGSKRQLVPELLARLPRRFGRYYEPFVGGGSLFFALRPERAVLGDLNADLIDAYRAVATAAGLVIRDLERHQRLHSRAHYYATRERWNGERAAWSVARRASTFIYLNKTCFNGLWRVNARSRFNVPMGAYANPTICDPDALHAAGELLRGADLRSGDYRRTLEDAGRGDLVYIDSPHQPRSRTSSFTAYTAAAFSERDQVDLAEVARALVARGCHVMLSNADTPQMRRLYRGFRVERVSCPRRINRNADRRGPVHELILTA